MSSANTSSSPTWTAEAVTNAARIVVVAVLLWKIAGVLTMLLTPTSLALGPAPVMRAPEWLVEGVSSAVVEDRFDPHRPAVRTDAPHTAKR